MLVLVMVLLLVFAFRVLQIQVINGPALAEKGQKARMKPVEQPAQRGQIISADGTVLASDVVRYEIQANPKVINAKDKTGKLIGLGAKALAAKLAPLLAIPEAQMLDQLSDPSRTWVELVKHAKQDQWEPVKALVEKYWEKDKIDIGVYPVKHYVRSYPAGTVAGNLVGYQFETEEKKGVKQYTGLEQVLDPQLAGKAGKKETEIGGYGQPIPGGKVTEDPARPGCNVTLTLDAALQLGAQEAIQAEVERANARAGMVVVLNVKTGEILALADSDTPDPSHPTGKTDGYTNSRSVENVFEPGSTGKVVTMAMLLEEGYAQPESRYSVPYSVTLGGQTFVDSHGHGVENLTLAGVLAESSNVGTVLAAQNTPDSTRYEYLKRFGFGESTGIELPLEAKGVVHQPGVEPKFDGDPYWDGRTRNTVLFGQGLSVNALQATTVFATLGNGGMRAVPHLIKGSECPGQEFEPSPVAAATKVVSPETASQLVTMMEQAVDSGTGKTAQVQGYRTAGKTGTSQMFEGSKQLYVGSFVGLVPAEDPQVAVGVFIIDPKGEGYYGSQVAAPVFQEVATAAVDRMGVAPSTTPPAIMALSW
jgi:cell division protein FtsI (penicillin-binding protein 3)